MCRVFNLARLMESDLIPATTVRVLITDLAPTPSTVALVKRFVQAGITTCYFDRHRPESIMTDHGKETMNCYDQIAEMVPRQWLKFVTRRAARTCAELVVI